MRSRLLLASSIHALLVLPACGGSSPPEGTGPSSGPGGEGGEGGSGGNVADGTGPSGNSGDTGNGEGNVVTGNTTNSTTPSGTSGPGGDPSGDPSGDPTSGGPDPVDIDRECPAYEGLIADFEEDAGVVLPIEDRSGAWEGFDNGMGARVDEIVLEGSESCNQGVFHTSGSGFTEYGPGIGAPVAGTEDGAVAYDATSRGYVGVSFRAKVGSNHANPVRFAVSTPWTDGGPDGDGSCETSDVNPNSVHPCYNHPGHFLIDEEALSTEWRTFTLCFDRDLHPEWLPQGGTVEQRQTVGSNVLGLQFKFNQSFDENGQAVDFSAPFDFYVDDIRLVTDGCEKPSFESSPNTSDPFGTNEAIGSCILPTNVEAYNAQITEAYLRWRSLFVTDDGRVIDPQEGGRVVSEAIGYGMLITAAMGDRETFDRIWGWAASRTSNGSQLLGWLNGDGGSGSATDADTDMAYALLMAAEQWGGDYAGPGNSLAQLALTQDVASNGVLGAGSSYRERLNPSYFSPGFYRAYSSNWSNVASATSTALSSCSSGFGGLLPDWCTIDGQPSDAGNAQQAASEVCPDGGACLAFDGARVPWRLGFDVCTGGSSRGLLESFMSNLYSKDPALQNGQRLDLLSAGWYANGPTSTAVDYGMAFIGPAGVGAMALGDQVALDRAFMATLDIIERPEFYGTYFQSTVGLMALLTMSGNWPTP